MKSVKIKGSLKDYAWGNDFFLRELLGTEAKGRAAEYWMGTHPSGDAVLEDGESLSAYISSDLEASLGQANAEKFKALPFLFKILAIEKPLSLQCHPDKKEAKDGWERERHLRESGGEYNYQDDSGKAEVIYALTPVSAMCGFRFLGKIEKNFSEFIPSSFERLFSSRLESIEKMFFKLYALSEDEKNDVLSELKAALESSSLECMDGPFLTERGIAERCLAEYEGDIGALAPLFMNVVHLSPGEALYLEPGTLHAYVLGNAVELMNASDNVLRGGLTKKRIDLEELKRIMDFSFLCVQKAENIADEKNRIHIAAPSDAFSLIRLDRGTYECEKETAIIISLEGCVEIAEENSTLFLQKGEAAFIPYSSCVRITVSSLAFEAVIP